MGRPRALKTDYAYIAGFLDGDGSIMVQVKKRSDTKQGWRFMFTICFYQDTQHGASLQWIREKLGIGYLSHRNDKMSELRINGYETVRKILIELRPYIKFKAKQVDCALKVLAIIDGKDLNEISKRDKARIARYVVDLRKENYRSHWRKYSEDEVRKIIVNGSFSP